MDNPYDYVSIMKALAAHRADPDRMNTRALLSVSATIRTLVAQINEQLEKTSTAVMNESLRDYVWITDGYYLVLTHGTKIYTNRSGRARRHARIDDGRLIYKGDEHTPASFQRCVTDGMHTNPWRMLFVKTPNMTRYERAIECRSAGMYPPPKAYKDDVLLADLVDVVSVRIANSFRVFTEYSNVHTVGDLRQFYADSKKGVPNIGKKSILELVALGILLVPHHGVKDRPSTDEWELFNATT